MAPLDKVNAQRIVNQLHGILSEIIEDAAEDGFQFTYADLRKIITDYLAPINAYGYLLPEESHDQDGTMIFVLMVYGNPVTLYIKQQPDYLAITRSITLGTESHDSME